MAVLHQRVAQLNDVRADSEAILEVEEAVEALALRRAGARVRGARDAWEAVVTMTFSGVLNDQMKGFYRRWGHSWHST